MFGSVCGCPTLSDVSRECRLKPAEWQKRQIAVVSPAVHRLTVYKSMQSVMFPEHGVGHHMPHCFHTVSLAQIRNNMVCETQTVCWQPVRVKSTNLYNLYFDVNQVEWARVNVLTWNWGHMTSQTGLSGTFLKIL